MDPEPSTSTAAAAAVAAYPQFSALRSCEQLIIEGGEREIGAVEFAISDTSSNRRHGERLFKAAFRIEQYIHIGFYKHQEVRVPVYFLYSITLTNPAGEEVLVAKLPEEPAWYSQYKDPDTICYYRSSQPPGCTQENFAFIVQSAAGQTIATIYPLGKGERGVYTVLAASGEFKYNLELVSRHSCACKCCQRVCPFTISAIRIRKAATGAGADAEGGEPTGDVIGTMEIEPDGHFGVSFPVELPEQEKAVLTAAATLMNRFYFLYQRPPSCLCYCGRGRSCTRVGERGADLNSWVYWSLFTLGMLAFLATFFTVCIIFLGSPF